MDILLTGVAGFIGFHTAQKLLQTGHHVTGIDNLNNYYDVNLKKARLQQIEHYPNFTFKKMDICDRHALESLFHKKQFDVILHLAAQAGVRYSIENPSLYIESNLVGFGHILEVCRHAQVKHLVYASTSSVYGSNTKQPFSENDNVSHPLTLYAATKRANELMAHSYSHLYHLPTTGLRFFTVYGPWGRPDMALFKFTQNILEDKEIEIYNEGQMVRDFTYIDDVVESITRVCQRPAASDPAWNSFSPSSATSSAPYRIYNIGNHQPVQLMDFIEVLEKVLKKKIKKTFLPMQEGDVPSTHADCQLFERDFGFRPSTPVERGIKNFVDWYLNFYKHNET